MAQPGQQSFVRLQRETIRTLHQLKLAWKARSLDVVVNRMLDQNRGEVLRAVIDMPKGEINDYEPS